MTTKLVSRARHRNGHASLPLLDAIDCARVRALPLPARRLVRLYGLTPSAALTQAQAAGYRCEADR